ncbi:hypothetical protein D9M71_633760 [compost metagenome]
MLPVAGLFDRCTQAFDCRATFALGDAQALAGDARGVDIVGKTNEVWPVPVAVQLGGVHGLAGYIQALFQNRHPCPLQPG